MTPIDADAVAVALDDLAAERAYFSAKDVALRIVDDPDAGDINAAAYHLSDLRAERDDVTVWSDAGRNNTYQFVDDAPEVRADGGTIHTSIEIDGDLWRELRAEGIEAGREVAAQLEAILRERYRARADGGPIETAIHAHKAVDGHAFLSFDVEFETVDALAPPEETARSTVEWLEHQFFTQDWADDVVEQLYDEHWREVHDHGAPRVGTLQYDPEDNRVVDVTFDDPRPDDDPMARATRLRERADQLEVQAAAEGGDD